MLQAHSLTAFNNLTENTRTHMRALTHLTPSPSARPHAPPESASPPNPHRPRPGYSPPGPLPPPKRSGSACGILTFPETGCSLCFGVGDGAWVRRMENFSRDYWSLGPRLSCWDRWLWVYFVYREDRRGPWGCQLQSAYFRLSPKLGKG